jgi:demethylmenaquinone methyltransferase / 2-methoxy-6-polyprenyl-1,4-benzoquinol methylase
MSVITPYNTGESKKEQVRDMFNNISSTYDGLNRVISLGIDKRWRKRAIALLAKESPSSILDIATGTADFAIAATSVKNAEIVGVDIAEEMLAIGRNKVKALNLEKRINLLCADSENLPFENNMFDASIVSFGVRNFENLEKGLSEILRVIKPGGVLIVLEASTPQKQPMKFLNSIYSGKILPVIGRLVSKDKKAYKYLPESIEAFPCGEAFTSVMNKVGFQQTFYEEQTFGVCTIYLGRKV